MANQSRHPKIQAPQQGLAFYSILRADPTISPPSDPSSALVHWITGFTTRKTSPCRVREKTASKSFCFHHPSTLKLNPTAHPPKATLTRFPLQSFLFTIPDFLPTEYPLLHSSPREARSTPFPYSLSSLTKINPTTHQSMASELILHPFQQQPQHTISHSNLHHLAIPDRTHTPRPSTNVK